MTGRMTCHDDTRSAARNLLLVAFTPLHSAFHGFWIPASPYRMVVCMEFCLLEFRFCNILSSAWRPHRLLHVLYWQGIAMEIPRGGLPFFYLICRLAQTVSGVSSSRSGMSQRTVFL